MGRWGVLLRGKRGGTRGQCLSGAPPCAVQCAPRRPVRCGGGAPRGPRAAARAHGGSPNPPHTHTHTHKSASDAHWGADEGCGGAGRSPRRGVGSGGRGGVRSLAAGGRAGGSRGACAGRARLGAARRPGSGGDFGPCGRTCGAVRHMCAEGRISARMGGGCEALGCGCTWGRESRVSLLHQALARLQRHSCALGVRCRGLAPRVPGRARPGRDT